MSKNVSKVLRVPPWRDEHKEFFTKKISAFSKGSSAKDIYFFALAAEATARFLKRSTRPAVSRTFSFPV
jgi:hypothetical protein